jgi:toxin YoeB
LESDTGNYVLAVYFWYARINQGRNKDTDRGMYKGSRLVKWQVVFTKQAQKDAIKLAASGLRSKAEQLLETLRENPFKSPLCCMKSWQAIYTVHFPDEYIQHRLVYQVLEEEKIVKVIRMWTHYE